MTFRIGLLPYTVAIRSLFLVLSSSFGQKLPAFLEARKAACRSHAFQNATVQPAINREIISARKEYILPQAAGM